MLDHTKHQPFPVQGAGLGLRRDFIAEVADSAPAVVDFYEVAPENWIKTGGRFGRQFRQLTEQHNFVSHGLSLSIGGPSPLDESFVQDIKLFLDQNNICAYTEHLSYCSDDGHLYDLLPIPFTPEAVTYVADRIKRVQDILEQRIGIENVSYYAAPGQQMTESEFINAVLVEADCDLLLDINNIFVNSINHRYDPVTYLKSLPAERLMYFHIAGHYVEAEDLRIDTHGADICTDVWDLLKHAYQHFGVVPTLLERDFNIPPMNELLTEVEHIKQLQTAAMSAEAVA